MKGFKNCYYNRSNNCIYLKESGETDYKKIPYKHWYYLEDANGEYRSLFGVKMKKIEVDSPPYKVKDDIKSFNLANLRTAESDLDPVIKFLQNKYGKEDIKSDINEWKIAWFDIETGVKYSMYERIRVKKIGSDTEESYFLWEFEKEKNQIEYMVYDVEKNKWVQYLDSCYVYNKFPKPDDPEQDRYKENDEDYGEWLDNSPKYSLTSDDDDEEANDKEDVVEEYTPIPINLISVIPNYNGDGKVYSWGLHDVPVDEREGDEYFHFEKESDMLKHFVQWFYKQKIDIILGWNSKCFDIPYIINRLRKLEKKAYDKAYEEYEANPKEYLLAHKNEPRMPQYEKYLSPLKLKPIYKDVVDKQTKQIIGHTYDIPGLICVDYMEAYKYFAKHDPLPSFSLNYVGHHEIGEGKLEYDGQINQIYKTDWVKFYKYNKQDAKVMPHIERKIKIIPLMIEFAYDTICPMDKIFMTVPTSEGYIIKFIHKEQGNLVLPDRVPIPKDWWREEKCYIVKDKFGNVYYQNTDWENPKVFQSNMALYNPHPFKPYGIKAGYCYAEPGRYTFVMSGDITSSYPHHIMMYNISPEVKVIHPTREQIESGEVILSCINEVGFRNTNDAILPRIVKAVFDERKYFKNLRDEAHEKGDQLLEDLYENRQLNKKRIINSMYGVCLTTSFHLYDIDCARAITRCARVTLRDYLKRCTEELYTNKYMGVLTQKYFPTINIKVGNNYYFYKEEDEITIMRNGVEMKVLARDFNKETDLIGVDDEKCD